MENLPNKSKRSLDKILKLFEFRCKTMNELSKVFFGKYCPFFDYVSKKYQKEEKEFISIFPQLRNLVNYINELFPLQGVDLLKTKEINKQYTMTRKQVALIFLLSFFDLIKIRESNKKNYFDVSSVLFLRHPSALNFGLCFLNYLTVIGNWLAEHNPILDEEIIYKRKNISSMDYINAPTDNKLCEVVLHNNKDSLFYAEDSYFVDFANKYIGGGVLNGGCVQEEIFFAVDPEAIVSMFFMEVMDDCDAIGIYNTIMYSKYKGYGYSFTYDGTLIDGQTIIKSHRIIAIDAISFSYNSFNFNFFQNNNKIKEINRDLHKAYVGFSFAKNEEGIPKTIATGNWGCGAFNGNHELKFIQQWIAASFLGIDKLDYFTFGDENMKNVVKYFDQIKNKFKNAKELYDNLIGVSTINDNYIKNLLSIQYQ